MNASIALYSCIVLVYSSYCHFAVSMGRCIDTSLCALKCLKGRKIYKSENAVIVPSG